MLEIVQRETYDRLNELGRWHFSIQTLGMLFFARLARGLSIALLLLLPAFFTCLCDVRSQVLSRSGDRWLTVGVRFAFTLGVEFIGLMGTAGNLCGPAFDGIHILGACGGVFALNMKGSDNDLSSELPDTDSVNEKLSYSY